MVNLEKTPIDLLYSAYLAKCNELVLDPAQFKDERFPQQHNFVIETNRYLAALCTRRAGKSNGLALRFFRTMAKYKDCFCPYVALTRESAKNIMWPVLKEQSERFKIEAKFTDSNLTCTFPNGSRLQLFGADMKNFIGRLKGIKTPGAAIDEAQEFGPHIESLVDDVLGPAILDYQDGWLALTGTPGPVPNGLFYRITYLRQAGYAVHSWSLHQNPYLQNTREFVADLKSRKQWADNHPTLLREYEGLWVMDLEALVLKFTPANHFEQLPQASPQHWFYGIGVDIGFEDADAIAVLAWNRHLKAAYLVEESVVHGEGITELAEHLNRLIAKYNPDRVVMDTGGLGKKIAEEIKKRYAIPVEPAEKSRKVEFIELLNDALRMGKFFAPKDSRFSQDCQKLKWDFEKCTPDKMVVSDSFHSDIIDAVLYIFRESQHWLFEPEPEIIKPGTERWRQKQVEQIEQTLERELQTRQGDADDSQIWGDYEWQ